MVENKCHLNLIWKIFSLGGPSKFIASICDPFKSTVSFLKLPYLIMSLNLRYT